MIVRHLQRCWTFQTGARFAASATCHHSPLRLTARMFSLTAVDFASDRRYTKKHEWVSVATSSDSAQPVGTVGISHFAQVSLGDVVYVETPDVGTKVTRGESTGAVESVKAASDIYAPVSGTVVERNQELDEKPFLINKSTYDKGWLYKLELSDKKELNDLMDENAYEQFCKLEQNADSDD